MTSRTIACRKTSLQRTDLGSGLSLASPAHPFIVALSDEWLLSPEGKKAVRRVLEELVAELSARAAFLIDEDGSPFATVGSVEFSFPHPLSGLRETALLSALVGESHDEPSGYIVEKAGPRALLAVWLDPPPTAESSDAVKKKVRKSARELARLL